MAVHSHRAGTALTFGPHTILSRNSRAKYNMEFAVEDAGELGRSFKVVVVAITKRRDNTPRRAR